MNRKKSPTLRIKQVEEEDGWAWWLCAAYNSDAKSYVARGYLIIKGGIMVCSLWSKVSGTSRGEALVNAMGLVLEFVTEEARIKKKGLTLMVDNKNIVEWILGENKTCWQLLRFLRNKTHNMRDIMQNITVKFRNVYEFKGKLQWEQRALENEAQLVEWIDNHTPMA
ncbi:hypothetical protein PIB30_064165 [Stylosanthes scabra]|uniref:RNase H type-1 domain-containing protein n=1 Tax=Stylosanthes scabra TaxID=79078 RepID=A0ABU6XN15_9FABA|nr:hypothetical protein [Stylosanthes scabra]